MENTPYIEEPFYFGEQKQCLGVLTAPVDASLRKEARPLVVIMLNSGLVHREGPFRLNVRLARQLAELGVFALRVDLSGKGDSPERKGLNNRESVAADWEAIRTTLVAKFDTPRVVVMGLCSGADNAIKVSVADDMVKGLILLDPVVPQDSRFALRKLLIKLKSRRAVGRVLRGLQSLIMPKGDEQQALNLRDLPWAGELEQCMTRLVACKGKVLAVFSSYAFDYYNQQGQFVRALAIDGFDQICSELYWPHVAHTYTAESHRQALIKTARDWVAEHQQVLRV
ncbi:MAG: alpha/beta hydrolase [Oleiphilaceae bacterium]|nr:alpha/beta hydrolase [Oleiphilaceae bacterium]